MEFEGLKNAEGYRHINPTMAGWKFGFVAYKTDGTRYYSQMQSAGYNNPKTTFSYTVPEGCEKLWLIVSGAPKSYWTRYWTFDDDDDIKHNPISEEFEKTFEQWPIR